MDKVPDYEDLSDEEKIDIRNLSGALDIGADLSGWNDLYLKEQIKKALREIGFQNPSEVQKLAIPIIMQGRDVLCQARSGMGKTAVFIIGVLNQLSLHNGYYKPFSCLVICHTRELAHQIFKDFRRFAKYFKNPDLRIGCFFGGLLTNTDRKILQNESQLPHIIIGTTGRLMSLWKSKLIPMEKIQYFIIDECDQVISNVEMMKTVNTFYKQMSHSKQVMMFSATISESTIKTAKQMMNNGQHIFVDTGKLALPELAQFNIFLLQRNKLETLMNLLDSIKFNQGVIFLNKVERTKKLTNILMQKLFNPICIHSNMLQEDRIKNYDTFKLNKARLLIATDLFGRGIDVERVNLVINYDLPLTKESYFHRIGRAGRFNNRGLAINFVCEIGDESQEQAPRRDVFVMKQIEQGLQRPIPKLPADFDSRKYI